MESSLLDSDGARTRAGRFRPRAERALAGESLSRGEPRAVLESDEDGPAARLAATFAACAAHFGQRVRLYMQRNETRAATATT
jgi:hypothetical protein